MASEVFMGLSFPLIKSSLIVYMFQGKLYIRLTPNLLIQIMPHYPIPPSGFSSRRVGDLPHVSHIDWMAPLTPARTLPPHKGGFSPEGLPQQKSRH